MNFFVTDLLNKEQIFQAFKGFRTFGNGMRTGVDKFTTASSARERVAGIKSVFSNTINCQNIQTKAEKSVQLLN